MQKNIAVSTFEYALLQAKTTHIVEHKIFFSQFQLRLPTWDTAALTLAEGEEAWTEAECACARWPFSAPFCQRSFNSAFGLASCLDMKTTSHYSTSHYSKTHLTAQQALFPTKMYIFLRSS